MHLYFVKCELFYHLTQKYHYRLFVNQIGGKLSDVLGRKMFYLVGPITSILCGFFVNTFGDNFYAVTACRVMRILMTGFSSSVMSAT